MGRTVNWGRKKGPIFRIGQNSRAKAWEGILVIYKYEKGPFRPYFDLKTKESSERGKLWFNFYAMLVKIDFYSLII